MATNKQKSGIGALVLAGASLVAYTTGWEKEVRPVYKDIAGIPTVCVGHTGPEVKFGDVWTKEQCDAILTKDILKHGEGLLACVTVPLNQNQYDALEDWTFNVGVGAACKSNLVKLLNMGNYTAACNELPKWNRAAGREVRGLTIRRLDEKKKCLTPVTPPVEVPATEKATA